jgi:protein ImuB
MNIEPSVFSRPRGISILSDNRKTDSGPRQELWLALNFPHFSLEALTRNMDRKEPCVLAPSNNGGSKIEVCNASAAALGVRVGSSIHTAKLITPVRVLERDKSAEVAAFDALCSWALQFTPVVVKSSAFGLLLNIRSSVKLFGGLDELVSYVRVGVRRLGYRVEYAVAPTPLAARVLSNHYLGKVFLDKKQLKSFMNSLAIAVLPIRDKQKLELATLGIKLIGDCCRLPRGGLSERFSVAFVSMLDRLLGDVADPQVGFQLPDFFESQVSLPWGVEDSHALLTAMQHLLSELRAYLFNRGLVTNFLQWELRGDCQQIDKCSTSLSESGRDFEQITLLVRQMLVQKRLKSTVYAISLKVTNLYGDKDGESIDLFKKKYIKKRRFRFYCAFES